MATATKTTSTRATNNENDLRNRVNHIEKAVLKISPQIDEIYKVIVGNEAFQQEGLISRVKKLEDQNEKNNALKNKLMGAFLVGGVGWTIIWEVVKKAFFKAG
jgi:hypothetical protein